MSQKKYQIFISSTYEDLKEERNAVMEAILELEHIPLGMEMFSAGNSDQWQKITRQIDDSDYYVLIVAFRYGSMDGDISYTEKEYDYAVSKSKPVISFIIEDSATRQGNHHDRDELKLKKLKLFKEKIKGGKKRFGSWCDKNELFGRVGIALVKEIRDNPQVGWERSKESNKLITEMPKKTWNDFNFFSGNWKLVYYPDSNYAERDVELFRLDGSGAYIFIEGDNKERKYFQLEIICSTNDLVIWKKNVFDADGEIRYTYSLEMLNVQNKDFLKGHDSKGFTLLYERQG